MCADPNAITATLSVPANIENKIGTTFNAIISVNKWNNEGGYKLIDLILYIPAGIAVTDLKVSNRLSGGSVSYNLEESTGIELESESSETVNGFITDLMGEIPRENTKYDTIVYENYAFDILDVKDRRIEKLKISILPEEDTSDDR